MTQWHEIFDAVKYELISGGLMCSQIYAHPVEGYKCFANANKSQGTYYTCCDLDTREIRYVTYIYDGYFMGYYLVQSPTKVTENYANCQGKIFLSSASNIFTIK